MILKKYVLKDNGQIIDVVDNRGFNYSSSEFGEHYGSICLKNIQWGEEYPDENIITSDNILDFISQGDLLDLGGPVVQVVEIEKDTGNYILYGGDIMDKNYKQIKSLLKKQPNGNYITYNKD